MNFVRRLISGILLTGLVFVLFILGGYPLAVVALGVSLLGFWELSKALANKTTTDPTAERLPYPPQKKFDYMDTIGFVGIVLYYLAMVFLKEPIYQFMVIALFVLAILFVYVFSFPKVPIDRISNVAFSFIYCPVMMSFFYMTREAGEDGSIGKYLIWMIAISAWGCDTCAYLVGVTLGKKKVFPNLSPKKSLEGCIGGILGAGILGGLYGYIYMGRIGGFLKEYPHIYFVTAGVCMFGAVLGILGDLVASGIKRNKGFKDFGNLIPGHGGMIDRIDSALAAAPMVYVFSMVIIKGYLKA